MRVFCDDIWLELSCWFVVSFVVFLVLTHKKRQDYFSMVRRRVGEGHEKIEVRVAVTRYVKLDVPEVGQRTLEVFS